MLILYVKIDFQDTIFKKIFGCAENLFLNEDGKWGGRGGAEKQGLRNGIHYESAQTPLIACRLCVT